MNYYIDFDNTLYETAKLTSLMIEGISNFVSKTAGKDKQKIFDEVIRGFNSTTGNIFAYAETIASKYGINSDDMRECVESIIDNGKQISFDDAKRFLKRLKSNGHHVTLLTYIPDKSNSDYQMRKIDGSGLKEYFDSIIITLELKFNLDLDYKNGIFIDDDPRDLIGLYEKNPIKVIRIRKRSNKRSKINIDNSNIEEHESFDTITVPKARNYEDSGR